jgi:excisionase family DNA binding protein
MSARPVAPVPRVALTLDEAAAALGVSRSHFDRHVRPYLRIIRSGSTRLVPVVELNQWADQAATLASGVATPVGSYPNGQSAPARRQPPGA